MRVLVLLSGLVLSLLHPAFAQQTRLTGRVTGPDGQPLATVRVMEKGTLNGTLTDAQGRYELVYDGADAVIRFSMFGYRDQEVRAGGATTMDVALQEGILLDELLVIGSRRPNRTAVETPVAVDVIDLPSVARSSGQLQVNTILNYAAPSFNVTRQSGADGADHIDPATLRGLGPDQTLVLVNGKRRHQSSLINIFGSRGRGNTGTDLNAIPVEAIDRIEVLRDGASAQYGSDAIAGVINVVLKSDVEELSGSITTGTHNARPPSEFAVLREDRFDGQQIQAGANYGFRLRDTGFLNATAEFLNKAHTNRPADPEQWDIYREQFGDAAGRDVALVLNAGLPVSETASLYGFGGANLRQTDAYAWTREADSYRNVPSIYPNGFNPIIQSTITDLSASVGVKTRWQGWGLDANNTLGSNRFHYEVDKTLNASLQGASPTHFDAGGFQLIQNTTGAGLTRLFPTVRSGLNLALGAELRLERYSIFAGEQGSYHNYGPIYQEVDGESVLVPGGAQGFPGFQPENELTESRTNIGAYADAELDVTPRLVLGAAGRFENYSDFGSTLNGKLASRLKVSNAVALRASASTGFRAPSLAQIYFNSTFTDFVGGVAVDKLIARNDSRIAEALGIPGLKQETATNLGAGVTVRYGAFAATVDGYQVDVDDRIVLTGAFEADDEDIGDELTSRNLGAVQFFTNALDTRTRGVDVVLTYTRMFGLQTLRASLAGNFNDMELGAVKTSPRLQGKEDIYFGEREKYFLLASAPPRKINLGLDYVRPRVDVGLRLNHFGKIELIDWIDEVDVYEPKTTTDLSVGYRLNSRAQLVVGGTNIFNVYPSQQDTETETGGVWDAVQMGFSGAFYFAKLNFRF